ncbi:hypothetical protein LPZ58_004101 [Escherichia coli]|nr:hypothetical protein [Escherichia coli]
MNISNSQVNRLRHFVRAGLRSLFRPEPQTAVEWADANYYLPKESAYWCSYALRCDWFTWTYHHR